MKGRYLFNRLFIYFSPSFFYTSVPKQGAEAAIVVDGLKDLKLTMERITHTDVLAQN